ncbi:hypothetical protein PILCRDRAFT_819327 [Piloderma croceum F 1598]|uniref:Heme haloperoxidase family profile domain-containing protein n=1 Tax=Piloderma croceum (strain F 1598) TaxID=765440 RepID=A0A0C3C2D1_PILCF|nr:hypothetical protein PILCRDRAFT_830324 [Piloderma croceum F 1598]KIM83682.1 hypothetical protein PILCRDRAFT_819327 [Piloderma croceum F 1598]
MGLVSALANFFSSIYIFLWDTLLAFGNLVLPKRPTALVVPDGHPGFGGKWPEYVPAKEGDSRCSCPGINALANHGIIAHDGQNISFVELAQQVQVTYNMAPTFCIFLSKYMAGFMKKDYSKDAFDLKDLDEHNKIEHDGSLIREDIYFEPDSAKIAPHLIEKLLDSASGKDADGKPVLTYSDLAKAFSQRQADSKANNPDFSMTNLLRMFAFGNCAAIALVFGGKVEDLRPFLLEERIVDGWVPWTKKRYGITMGAFNVASTKIALRTKTVPPTMVATLPLSTESPK